MLKLKSANHQKPPTHNMKGRKDNTDDIKRQGQHKRPNTNMRGHKGFHTTPAMWTSKEGKTTQTLGRDKDNRPHTNMGRQYNSVCTIPSMRTCLIKIGIQNYKCRTCMKCQHKCQHILSRSDESDWWYEIPAVSS